MKLEHILKYKKQIAIGAGILAIYLLYRKQTNGVIVKFTNSTEKPIEAETIELKTIAKK